MLQSSDGGEAMLIRSKQAFVTIVSTSIFWRIWQLCGRYPQRMTWTAVLLFASWVAYLNRVSPCSNAAQTNGIADYLKYRRREDMSCCFENCFCSVKVSTWTLSKYRQTLLVYFLTTSISPQNCIWVCLKIGYIPNERAIFLGDNDQQNHWVHRGTQHFQTNPSSVSNILLKHPEAPRSWRSLHAIHHFHPFPPWLSWKPTADSQ